MKILKVSGIVAGIHLFALIVILANPGCSSSTNPPKPADTAATIEPAPVISVPTGATAGDASTASTDHIAFNAASATPRYSPTRPGTSVATTLQTETVVNATDATTYVVVSGDTLSGIAKKHHITANELAAANNLNLNTAKLRPGQKLIILTKPVHAAESTAATVAGTTAATAKTDTTAAKSQPEAIKHTVKAGETLSGIARKYDVKQGDLAVANNITDPQKQVRPGMELVIPGWQSTGKKNTKSSSTAASSDTSRHSSDPKPTYAPVDTASAPATNPNMLPEVPVIKVEDAPATKP